MENDEVAIRVLIIKKKLGSVWRSAIRKVDFVIEVLNFLISYNKKKLIHKSPGKYLQLMLKEINPWI